MNKWVFIFVCPLSGCSGLPSDVHTGLDRITWEYVQSVGGMAIGDPYFDTSMNSLRIPLIHDFSGRTTVTTTPTNIGSSFECVWAQVAGWSGNILATDIDITFWGAEKGSAPRAYPGGCNEAVFPYPPRFAPVPRMPTFNVSVKFRDPGLGGTVGLNHYLLGKFSL